MGFLSNVIARLAEHTADLDAHTYNQQQLIRTGEYYGGGCGCVQSWTCQLAANRLYGIPFIAARAMSVDRIAVYINVLAAGKSARLGLYRNGTNNNPGALVVDGGEVSVDATGLKTVVIDEALTKGLYWMAIVSDGTPTPHGYAQYGSTIPSISTMSDGRGYEIGWYVAHTYGALPDPFGAATKHAYITIPGVSLRVASMD